MKHAQRSARSARAFANGVVSGFSAPAMLVAGAFETLPRRELSAIGDTWRDVGKFLRASSAEFRKRQSPTSAK